MAHITLQGFFAESPATEPKASSPTDPKVFRDGTGLEKGTWTLSTLARILKRVLCVLMSGI